MEIRVVGSQLMITRYDDRFRSGVSRKVIDAPSTASSRLLSRISEVVISYCAGGAFHTTTSDLVALDRILQFLKNEFGKWPTNEEWPIAIYNFFTHHYDTAATASGRNLQSTRAGWSTIRRLLSAFMDWQIIPEAPIPEASLPRKRGVHRDSESYVLGEQLESVEPANESTLAWPKAFLTDISYTDDTDQFFDIVQQQLESVSDAAFSVCQNYWKGMINSHQLGRELISKVNRDQLISELNKPVWSQQNKQGQKFHSAHPRTPNGLNVFLAAVEYFFLETDQLNALNWRDLAKIPYLAPVTTSFEIQKTITKQLIEKIQCQDQNLQFSEILCRALGLLSTRDCAAAAGILMHEQPKYTAEALETANAYTKNGKLEITVSLASGHKHTLMIDKLRAHNKKGGMLTDVAFSVYEQIAECTSGLRKKVAQTQPTVARKLFLIATRDGFGHTGRLGASFNSKSKPSVFDTAAEELEAAGLTRATFTLSRVRNTQGILEWLKTGSALCMAILMGNSEATVRSSYIPDWLIRRMNERVARRFQQKTILLATANTEWQLEASDFESSDQLYNFVNSLLTEDRYGNPYSDKFTSTFGDQGAASDASGRKIGEATAYICLTPETIALLEVYVSAPKLYESYKSGNTSGPSIHLEACHITALYQLIKSAVTENSTQVKHEAIFELIRGGSRAKLKSLWAKSRPLVEFYKSKIKFDSDVGK